MRRSNSARIRKLMDVGDLCTALAHEAALRKLRNDPEISFKSNRLVIEHQQRALRRRKVG